MATFQQWADQVLRDAGVPISNENENTLWKWARSESGSNPFVNGRIRNNPLNTKQPFSGAQDSGISVTPGIGGVKSYADLTSSARATAQTLTNGYYPDILSMLQNSVPTKDWSSAARAQVSKWGTSLGFLGGNASAPSNNLVTQGATLLGGAAAGAPSPLSGIPLLGPLVNAITGAGSSIAGGLGSIAGAGAAQGGQIAGGIQSAEQDAISKVISVAEIMLGSALILAGLAILAVLTFQKTAAPVRNVASKAVKVAAVATPQGRGAAVAASVVKPAAKPTPASKPAPAKPAPEPTPVRAGGRNIDLTPLARARLRSQGVAV